MKRSYSAYIYKDIVKDALRKIKDWFRNAYGISLTNQQATVFAIHTTTEVSGSIVAKSLTGVIKDGLEKMNVSLDTKSYYRLNSLHSTLINGIKMSRVDTLTAIVLAASVNLPTPRTTSVSVKRDRLNKDVLSVLNFEHQLL